LGARFDEGGEWPDPIRSATEVVPVHPRHPAHPQTLAVLDSLPVGLLVYRGETPLFANRLLLHLSGYEDVHALARNGVSRLFPGRLPSLDQSDEDALPLTLATLRNESLPVDVRLATLQWEGVPAIAMVVRRLPENDPTPRLRALELDLRASEARLRELASILDTAADGVIVLDEAGRILSLNRSAEVLFGYDQREVAGESVTALLASESHDLALDYLDGLRGSGVAGLLNDGREVLGRVRQGGTIPLFMTAGRASEAPERKFCVVLRDITALKKAEAELYAAKRAAENASVEKSDFLAKVSHELRTPLNAIIGFAEVMLEERFGSMGNERYKDYLKDIHDSGRRVIGLVNDLLDLAKIEAGRMELSFAGVSLNDIVANCVSALLQNATRERIVIRTSFAPNLPPVVADQRSVRQSVTNIVTNAVKFTEAGGQVIVSTAMTDRGEVVIRVRDTGVGMTDGEVEAALKPLRQLSIARKGGGGTGLGLPLAKALVEANRGTLRITSAPGDGTLVEIVFPPTRVLAQ
jgi:PAS domain S-box-containing protein